MTAPAQMTPSASISVDGSRVLRTSSGPSAENIRDADETSSSDDSSEELARTTEPGSAEYSRVPGRLEGQAGPVRASQAASPEDGGRAGPSSCGALLRQYFTAPSSAVRSG
jgi:hypothetical protein